MKIYNYKWLLLLLVGVVTGCSSDDDSGTIIVEPGEYTSGSADFSHYVALGNSLTAGLTDGTLFLAGQQNSLPNILAEQFELTGGGEFTQPLINDNIGGLLLGGNVIQEPRLFFNGSGPQRLTATPTTEITSTLSGPFNNMGVPGAKSFHLLAPGYGNVAGVATGQSNPYFVRFASSPATTVLADAVAQDPTFFSLWIGNNDVLSYATSGGVGVDQTGNFDPSTYGSNDITDPNVFAQVYSTLLDALTANGADGVVANIPNVTSLPYFTTVPRKPVPLDATTAAALNNGYAQYNGGLQLALANNLINAEEAQARMISFAEGQNAVVIEDENLTNLSALGIPSYRMVTDEDLIVLTAASFIGTTAGDNPQMINGVSVPLADKWVLTKAEQEEVLQATAAYNQTIESLAEAKGLAFVDVNSILVQLADSEVAFDEYFLNSKLVFGGAFSLDGVHPTARGYAYLANKFIAAINETYNSNLPPVKAVDYNVIYPSSM
ncbi:G-D-S-L family lipolytic protein [Antarcticibacterium sp. 1MA-6-2]|uniref:SGNH/GDSL hydrolase family protein n=1 Tax=Antarcticibacterium sp. 1MA-6-2 TaxID=2908210 RepID=UPI001F174D8D|nr:SGNH/GDSL hydrolase family protein [Antarcticibacterium sp. 1MA-6-2]UJH91453.1 G-D-S-L family lipolytic protein [Antarcticibacterium sp. 1MA-6-2]